MATNVAHTLQKLLKSWWDTYSGNFSIIVGDTRHGPSKIPTDVDLPHKTFGSQLVDDSQYERPDILPFSTYAACRILDTNPEDMDNGEIYEALCTMAACYVRADMTGICDCLEAYKLTDTLTKATHIGRAQQVLARSCSQSEAAKESQALRHTDSNGSLADEVRHDSSFQHTVNGKSPSDPDAELQTLQGTIGALMHELEAILHEYLSFNWDRMEEINKANAHLQREGGLMCPWRPSRSSDGSQALGLSSQQMNDASSEEHYAAVHDGEPPSPPSHSSSTPPSPSSQGSSPSPSRLRRVTLPDHLQASHHQHRLSQMEPLEEEQERPQQAPASPQRAPSPQPSHDPHASQRPMSPQRSISPQFSRRSRRQSIDQDGFDSDPESSSRALRLRALHNSPGSARPHLPSPKHASPRHASPRASSPPGRVLPRKGGIRRVQSEAQLLTRLSARSGDQLALGSFGSQTSDSTRSFDEYLRRHRSRSPSPKRKAHQRAQHNWQRAQKAAEKSIAMNALKGKRELITLAKLAEMLNGVGDQSKLAPDRQPICLLLGGGMAAGKSTVRKIIGEAEFWTRVGKDAVVVEADAMKSMDVIYKQLSKMSSFKSEPDISSYVHEYSTKQAEALFVSAINRQKDVIFDGTMMWAPFVEQTIAMVRDYKRNYRRGPGYKQHPDGSVTEQYWELDPADCETCSSHKPYRIEVIGVTCDAGLAVARGVWRKLRTGRSVRSSTLLRSHRLFSEHFERTASLVDTATLYHTGRALTTFNKNSENLQPKVIALRSMQHTSGDMLLNPPAYADFKAKVKINDKATCRGDLYKGHVTTEQTGVPISQEGQMSTLRQAFRQADEEERKHLHEALMQDED